MSVKLVSNEKSQAVFEVEFSAESFESAIEKAYHRNVGKMSIQGFRKGKAPRKIIEAQYGVEVFYEDAINNLLSEGYEQAVEELVLDVIDRPSVEVLDADKETGVKVKFTVAIKPEVELGEYKGIEIKKVEYNVSDLDVEENLKAFAEKNVRLVPVEGDAAVAENGDLTTIDFEGFVGEVPFEGGKGENYDLELGSASFIPGFEEQIVGKKLGEEFDVNVTFPEEYHAEELKGKEAVFKVKLNSIKRKEYPDMDDEFAKDVSEFETIAEFKADIRAKLEKVAEERQNGEIETAVIDKIIEGLTVEVPDVMIEEQLHKMAHELDHRMQSQGLNLEQYLKYTNTTMDDFNEQHRETALAQVKANLAIEAVTKAENIEVSDEEVEAEYTKMSELYKTEVEHVKEHIPEDIVKKDLRVLKTVKFLVDNAKFVD
jgi:trigger factor